VNPEPPPPVPTSTPDAQPPAADNRPRVVFAASGGDAVVHVEVVSTEAAIMKGLMYRQYLAPDDGMLFLMGAEDNWHFWMKNTLIPLDIIFITRDFTVAGILYDMQPMDTTSKHVGKQSLYVLEVNAGWAKPHGVAAGTKLRFEGVPPTDR
jgi:uncharacterized membrane protein (UPF0127 family)